jgi:Tol biopolymer transport system component/DNA-binding winged helix-turn-helix (wHTH) protein
MIDKKMDRGGGVATPRRRGPVVNSTGQDTRVVHPGQSPKIIRFGAFEVDLNAGELRKQGLRLRLQEQPFQVLSALLENPGEVVGREDLVRRLWPDGTVVDFDRGLNAAVTRLRQALSDSAETPRYVETVARRGYRFIAPVDSAAEPPLQPGEAQPELGSAPPLVAVRHNWLRPAAAVVIVLVLAAVWWLLLRSQPSATDGAYTVMPLTSEPGFERSPSFSPDGSQIAFEWDQDTGQPHIFVKVTGTGDPVRLTTSPSAEYAPVWSRDGRSIAFVRPVNGSIMSAWVIPAVGGVERKVAEFPVGNWISQGRFRRLDWMPDNRHLVISGAQRAGEGECLFLVDSASGEISWLTRPRAGEDMYGDLEPAAAPDGRSIAFTRGVRFISQHLHLLPLAPDMRPAGEPRKLVATRLTINPAWTPDGREIIFRFGPTLARIGLDAGAKPRELLALGTNAFFPTLSRTGRLAFSRNTDDTNVWRQELPAHEGALPPPERLIASTAQDQNARYSPDGSKIAFQSDRSGQFEIWLCGSDGAHCAQLTNINRPFITGTPRWSPDGKWIAFDSAWEGRFHIYVVNATGGTPRRLTADSIGGYIPTWSHDGRWVYYSTFTAGRNEIWKVPSAGGAPVQVTHAGGYTAFESPDGTLLYYTKAEADPTLWQSALDGSQEREALRGVTNRGFVIARDVIYYLSQESGTEIALRRFRLSSREDIRLSGIVKPMFLGLSLSPDGRYLIYSKVDQQGADLMMVENFR